jgi:DNA processing protein
MDDLAGFIALALAPDIGPVRLRILLAACGSPDGAFSAPFERLCALHEFNRAAATGVRSARREEGERILRRVEALGGAALTYLDPAFPPILSTIPQPPALLFVSGGLGLLDPPAVAIVGSRDHSAYGAAVCRAVATRAAEAGIVVVSGMARGLDAVAHHAALDGGGPSIGVLGNGLGVIYPAANRELYDRMRNHGLLLTEFGPGERPNAGSFQRRNRLISGLARVTVVVEAAAGSGTLITVRAALDQGKDVMAVPGSITSGVSVGTNQLLRDGATPLLEPEDLLAFYPELPAIARRASIVAGSAGSGLTTAPPLPVDLTPEERAIAELLGSERLQLDDLAARSERPLGAVLATLSSLEVRGVVRQEPGRVFHR